MDEEIEMEGFWIKAIARQDWREKLNGGKTTGIHTLSRSLAGEVWICIFGHA